MSLWCIHEDVCHFESGNEYNLHADVRWRRVNPDILDTDGTNEMQGKAAKTFEGESKCVVEKSWAPADFCCPYGKT